MTNMKLVDDRLQQKHWWSQCQPLILKAILQIQFSVPSWAHNNTPDLHIKSPFQRLCVYVPVCDCSSMRNTQVYVCTCSNNVLTGDITASRYQDCWPVLLHPLKICCYSTTHSTHSRGHHWSRVGPETENVFPFFFFFLMDTLMERWMDGR